MTSPVKTTFGTPLRRLISGGVVTSPVERRILALFRENIDPQFHGAIDAQLAAYNLAQRHVEWRGLYLYRMTGLLRNDRSDLPDLPCADGDIKLLSLSLLIAPIAAPFHIVFWSGNRKFFGFDSGETLRPVANRSEIIVQHCKQSWRSHFERPRTPSAAPN